MTSMVIQAIIRGRRKNRPKGAIRERADRVIETEPGEIRIGEPQRALSSYLKHDRELVALYV